MIEKTRKQQLEAMVAEDPNDPFLRYALAMEHLSAGDEDEAWRCFHEILTRTPDYVPAYLQAGQLLARLGRTDEARNIYRKGIDIAQKQKDSHAAGEMAGFLEQLD